MYLIRSILRTGAKNTLVLYTGPEDMKPHREREPFEYQLKWQKNRLVEQSRYLEFKRAIWSIQAVGLM